MQIFEVTIYKTKKYTKYTLGNQEISNVTP
jgi:hypothetical protein